MPECRERELLHIVRLHEVATVQQRQRLCAPHQRQRSSRRRAQVDTLVLPRRVHQGHDVLLDERVDVDAAYGLLQLQHTGRVRHFLQRLKGVTRLLCVHDQHLVRRGRVTELDAEQEAVELGLRQWEGALVLNRVLRCHHHERVRRAMGDAVHSDLALLHRFQQ